MDNPILFSIIAFLMLMTIISWVGYRQKGDNRKQNWIVAFLMLMTIISWVGYRLIYKPSKLLRTLGKPVIREEGAGAVTADADEPQARTDRKSTRLNSSHIPLSRMP